MSTLSTPSPSSVTRFLRSLFTWAQNTGNRVYKSVREFFYGPIRAAPALSTVENRTAWRIQIKVEDQKEHLLLPPFGKRILHNDYLKTCEYSPWEQRGFVRIEACQPPPDPPPVAYFVHILTWFSLILTLVVLPVLWEELAYKVVLAISLVTLLFAERQPIFRWVAEAFNLFAIVSIALLLCYGFYVLFTPDQQQPPPIAIQGAVGVIFFIVIASSLPALLYYLFERQKSETLHEFFLRDVIRLNPHVHTLDEAEFRYGKLAEEVYSHKASQDFLGGLQVSLLINVALTTLGWSVVLMPNISRIVLGDTPDVALMKLINPQPSPIMFGLLGSYFFTLNLLFRRYLRADLNAKAYTFVAVRQLLTLILVWVINIPSLFSAKLGDYPQATLMVLAFLVGIVPETALTFIQDFLRGQKLLTSWFPSLQESQPLGNLEGINLYDQARLLEEGIESIENLAHHNLLDLMVRTRLPTSRLVDLVDQAILHQHFGGPQAVNEGTRIDPALVTLHQYGIRTATSLEYACKMARASGTEELKAFLSLLNTSPDQPQRLKVVLNTIRNDEWMAYLREWNRYRETRQAFSLADIDALLSRPADNDEDLTLPLKTPATGGTTSDQVSTQSVEVHGDVLVSR